MLKIDSLKQKLKDMEPLYRSAYRESFRQLFPWQSDNIDEAADKFADNMLLNHSAISEALAGIIDYYVKSIGISGTIVTQGTPATQTAQITFMPVNQLNGQVPNTLAIN